MDSLVSKLRAASGRPFSEADPVLDMNLAGVRLAVVGPPLSPSGVALAIRRHKPTPWTLPQFIATGFLTPSAAGLLSLLVDANASILITGSRGAGKTSLLGSLMLELPPKYRILTIEDTFELPVEYLRRLGFKVQSLRVQSAVSSSDVELRPEDALRAALRLGESVLVVGEVRGGEARTLYEAMRVGMAGNSVMGTIHGATAQDVFERVVHDLGIHPSSFKATDVIAVAAPIRVRGGLGRVRRLVQITEVRKGWRKDPAAEGGFVDLFTRDYSRDEIEPTSTFLESELMGRLARKWAVTRTDLLRNLELRADIYRTLVRSAKKLGRQGLLEAEFVVRSNLVWRGFFERELSGRRVSYQRVYRRWLEWFENHARGE
jgi:type IV secretory pathway ATPase VirB11/archaellum biosynthesis ATPase